MEATKWLKPSVLRITNWLTSTSAVGQHAKSATAPGMSPAGGIADEIRAKADFGPRMSDAGGRAEVDFEALEVRS